MMPSPFPGMDPYLEGDLWPDVHQALANQIRRQLMPLVQPKYVVRLGRYVMEDTHPEQELGIMYPDAGVFLGQTGVREAATVYAGIPVQHPKLEGMAYSIALTRAEASITDVWPVDLRNALPVVPVPLSAPDEDVPLDLQQALNTVYTEAAYHLSIDYSESPPPPDLSEADMAWIRTLAPAEK